MRTRITLTLPIVALAFGLVACSGGGWTPASTDGSSASRATSRSTADYDKEFDAYNLKLTTCIRAQGVTVADPEPGLGITYEDNPAFDAAYTSCLAEIGNPPISPNAPSVKERVEDGLKIAKCLREKGFDIKDPGPDGSIEIPDGVDNAALRDAGCSGT